MWNNQGGSYGGGFNDQGGQGTQAGGYYQSPGNATGSPGTGPAKQKRIQNLIPCTIAQIQQCTQVGDHFKIGEVELYQVSIIGLVRKVQLTATNIVYKVDDRTGPVMEIKKWNDSDENTPEDRQPQVFDENTYVKIIGNVRTFNEKNSITPFKIKQITDLNEITLHMLETVHTHMLLSKRKKKAANDGFGSNQFATPSKASGTGMANFQTSTMANGLSSVQAKVHKLITECTDDQGININVLGSRMKDTPSAQIRDALEFLSNEGHIYSTIDDDHFKSTDG